MNIIEQHLGAIDLSQEAVISDPCYGTKDQGVLATSFKPTINCEGEYGFDVYGGYTMKGQLAYIGVTTTDYPDFVWGTEYLGDVWVDSGYICLFTKKRFLETRGETGVKDDWYHENVRCKKQYAYQDDTGECLLIPLRGVPDGRYQVFGERDEDGLINSFNIIFIHPKEDDDFEIEVTISNEDDLDEELKFYRDLDQEDKLEERPDPTPDPETFAILMERNYFAFHNGKLKDVSDWIRWTETAFEVYDQTVDDFNERFKGFKSFFEIDEYGECQADDFKDEVMEKFLYRMVEFYLPDELKKCLDWVEDDDLYFIVECQKAIRSCNTEEELDKYYNGYLSGGVE